MQKKANPSAVRQQAAQSSSPSRSTRATQKKRSYEQKHFGENLKSKKSGEWATGRKQTRQKKQQDWVDKQERR